MDSVRPSRLTAFVSATRELEPTDLGNVGLGHRENVRLGGLTLHPSFPAAQSVTHPDAPPPEASFIAADGVLYLTIARF